MTTGIRSPGEFCWLNMLTPQPDQARAFFAKVLGWTYSEIPGMGYGVKVAGHDIGGLFDLEGPNTPKGTKAHIGVMVKVENADATCAKVVALGGTAMPAFDIGGRLRMAVCHDPNGAGFDLWESKAALGTVVDSSLHGAPSWFETPTSDTGRAAKFYSELFGWTTEVLPLGDSTYTDFKRGTEPVAGMMEITKDMGGMRPHWRVNFTVNDADEAAREALALGGTISVKLHDIPEVGRFCGITSPQGVAFLVLQYRS